MKNFPSLPLIFKNRLIGVVNLENRINPQPFLRNDEVLLSILANQSAVAIANTQLYDSAITDGLTHLHNQKYFRLSLIQEIERTKRYKCPYGGEEFAIIFLETEPADTFWIGERLRKKIEKHLLLRKDWQLRFQFFCKIYIFLLKY